MLNMSMIIGEPESSVTTPTVTATTGSYDTGLDVVTLNGNVTDDGGATVTERGFYYAVDDSTITNADTKLVAISGGTGTYSETVNEAQGFSVKTLYYRAYAVNSEGEVLSSNTESITILSL